jgi:hypothetical protein
LRRGVLLELMLLHIVMWGRRQARSDRESLRGLVIFRLKVFM